MGAKVAQLAPPGGQPPRDQGVRAASRDRGMKRDAVSRALKVASDVGPVICQLTFT